MLKKSLAAVITALLGAGCFLVLLRRLRIFVKTNLPNAAENSLYELYVIGAASAAANFTLKINRAAKPFIQTRKTAIFHPDGTA